jgi:hypothetical protein
MYATAINYLEIPNCIAIHEQQKLQKVTITKNTLVMLDINTCKSISSYIIKNNIRYMLLSGYSIISLLIQKQYEY